MTFNKIFLTLCTIFFLGTGSAQAMGQQPGAELRLLGTRSWIRIDWNATARHVRLYWAAGTKRPAQPNATAAPGTSRFYIRNVKPETAYTVWLEYKDENGRSNIIEGHTKTGKAWVQDPADAEELASNPSSRAVPAGMEVYWQDEFNDSLLNRNKWTTNYFSSLNYLNEDSRREMQTGTLPQPAYVLNGKTINLYVSDSLPARLFTKKGNQKISSIQTYDWQHNENLLDNSRGGYFEVKVKRSSQGNVKGLNTAFWFDAPGPDIRYYLQEGGEALGIKGIRPKGQLFEIDVFEYINAQFVIHGHVDSSGKFQRNLATHIAEGYTHRNEWVTHGMLWTPTSLKHYINGNLIKEYTDKHKIYSPNHFMNVFLGTYGSGGNVNMEVDYIRYYRWPLQNGNELPGSGFEEGEGMGPWEGSARIVAAAGRNNSKGLVMQPGEKITQYVYLDNHAAYQLMYFARGKGKVKVDVFDVAVVTGGLTGIASAEGRGGKGFMKNTARFTTGRELDGHTKTVCLVFENTGQAVVTLDDLTLSKR